MEAVGQHRPDGIVCDNDRHAAIIMRHLLNAKIAIPGDIKLAGFDDTPTSRQVWPSLTTIQVPTALTWQRAGEYLVRHLAGENIIKHHEVDFSLVVRESTAPPRR